MKTINRIFVLSATMVAICMSRQNAAAQPNFGGGNFDPQQMIQQMQQRTIDNLREQLAVTNDAEWSAIEPLITKVVQARTTSMIGGLGGLGGMGGMMGGRGGGGRGGGFAALGQQPDPNVDTLQSSVDNNAPPAQIKTALAKLRDARKQKQAELEKIQTDLRSVLTTRQEAILVLAGLLD
jgi:hypothetical protein